MDIKHEVGLRLIKFCNVVVMTAVFSAVWFFYYANRMVVPYFYWGNVFVLLLFVTFYFIFGKTYDAFLISHYRISDVVINQSLALVISDAIMYVIIVLLVRGFTNPIPLVLCFGVQITMSMVWTVIAHTIYFQWFPPKKTIIIYDRRRGMKELIDSYDLNKKFRVDRTIAVKDCLADLSIIDDEDVVFFSGVHSHDRNKILKYCLYKDKQVYMIPRVGDVVMSSAKKMHMFNLPIMRVERYNPNPLYLLAKRFFDIVASLLALIVTSPVFLVTSIAIWAYDFGPIFYKQERLTQNGKKFLIHKFRSMKVDAEKDGVARLSTGDNDDRITPIGHFIRKCRIDELPQFLDILVGNLSIVGPRPERPEIAKQYEKEMPEFQLRLQAKAGLTGYAQVYGKYNTTPYDKLQMDLMYIAHPSFIEDIRICFATIRILFVPESTEGITEGASNAMDQNETCV